MVELSNIELEQAAKKYKIPLRAVLSKDLLPYDNASQAFHALPMGGYIINLENSVDSAGNRLGGTHWTAFYLVGDYRTGRRRMIYFDPFGAPPPLEVQKLAETLRAIPLKYSKIQVQSINSGICGYYSLYFVWYMRNAKFSDIEKKFESFLKKWNPKMPEKNRKILQGLLKFV